MKLTRTHALYYSARKLPIALREHAPDVTIDDAVNAHATLPYRGSSEPNNTIAILRSVRNREGEAAMIAKLYGMRDNPNCIAAKRRGAFCGKWIKNLEKQRGRKMKTILMLGALAMLSGCSEFASQTEVQSQTTDVAGVTTTVTTIKGPFTNETCTTRIYPALGLMQSTCER